MSFTECFDNPKSLKALWKTCLSRRKFSENNKILFKCTLLCSYCVYFSLL